MRRNDSWMSPSSSSSYARGSHSRRSSGSLVRLSRVVVFLAVLIVILAGVQLLRSVPLPKAQSSLASAKIPGQPPTLPWPAQGSGQVDIQHVGVIGQFNPNAKVQLASVAKIVTALVIVKDHPLALGSSGPSIALTSNDAAIYRQMFGQQDSVMAVVPGENLSEYMMLEALLIPSADNIAVKLAQWDAGSTAAFVAKMNAYAKSIGMSQTVFDDPSGLTAGTVGTAQDQLLAAKELLKNKVLSQIVGKAQATLPVVGTVFNVNYNVGHDGFIGIKTGSMGSGANLVFAAKGASGSSNLIIGALMGQQGTQPLSAALVGSTKLVDAARKVPVSEKVLSSGQNVATITAPGGQSVPVVATRAVQLIGWPGLAVSYSTKFVKLSKNVPSGTKVGTLTVSVGTQSRSVSLVTNGAITAPSLAWRLKRL